MSKASENLINHKYILKNKDNQQETYINGRIIISIDKNFTESIESIYIQLKSSDWLHKGYYK